MTDRFFTDKQIELNPILEAAEYNGYFQAQYRWQNIYGEHLWHITKPKLHEDAIIPDSSVWEKLRAVFRARKPIKDNNPELYLANINGREYLEGRYLLSAASALKSKQGTFLLFLGIYLIYFGFTAYFAFYHFAILSTWLMTLAYFFMVAEFVRGQTANPMGVFVSLLKAEISRWKVVDKVQDKIELFLTELTKFVFSLFIILPAIFVGSILLTGFIFLIGETLDYLSDYRSGNLIPYLETCLFDYYAMMVFTFIFMFIALIQVVLRNFRTHLGIQSLLKTFEQGRREYDRYYICKVEGDLEDGKKWIEFYYDNAFEQFAKDRFRHDRFAEQPMNRLTGFGSPESPTASEHSHDPTGPVFDSIDSNHGNDSSNNS